MVIKQGLIILSPSTVWSAGVAVDCITVAKALLTGTVPQFSQWLYCI